MTPIDPARIPDEAVKAYYKGFEAEAIKKGAGSGTTWFCQNGGNGRSASSTSLERREWSAKVAKIPLPLAGHIARTFKPSPGPERGSEG